MTAQSRPRFLDQHGWPVIDRLLAELFRQRLVVPDKSITVGTVLNDDVAYPAVLVERIPGGGRNADDYEDVNRIQVTTFGTTRPESDSLTAQVRHELANLSDDEFDDVGVDRITEETGPGRVPDPDQDLRAVPTTWSVIARQQ